MQNLVTREGKKGPSGKGIKGREGTVRGREGKGRRAAEEEDRGESEGTWNRAADWLRPALTEVCSF